jgi:hypothetical protein
MSEKVSIVEKERLARVGDWPASGYRIGTLACLIGATGIYLQTMALTVQGFDSAELTLGAYTLGFVHPPGYPLYMILGHLFTHLPIGTVGLRLNLMSVVCGVLTVSALYELLCAQTHDWPASFLSTALFATTPIFWSQAIRAEVYTLHTLLVVSVLLAWWYAHGTQRLSSYLLCFVLLGVGMANHPTTALLWIALVICAFWDGRRRRLASLGGTAIGLLVAAIAYLYFPWRNAAGVGIDYIQPYFNVNLSDPADLWWLASFQAFQSSFHAGPSLQNILDEIYRLLLSLWGASLGLGFVLGLWGWWRLRAAHPQWNRLLSCYFLINVAGFVGYHVVDKEAMFIPLYLVGSIWIASGIGAWREWTIAHTRQPNPSAISRLIHLILVLVVALGVALNWSTLSLRDNRRVYTFAIQTLEAAEPASLIVNGWPTAAVFDYLRVVEGRRPDVQSFNLDFYFLALQSRRAVQEQTSLQQQWFAWLTERSRQRRLCFVEPLPQIPNGLRWAKQVGCWKLAPRGAQT